MGSVGPFQSRLVTAGSCLGTADCLFYAELLLNALFVLTFLSTKLGESNDLIAASSGEPRFGGSGIAVSFAWTARSDSSTSVLAVESPASLATNLPRRGLSSWPEQSQIMMLFPRAVANKTEEDDDPTLSAEPSTSYADSQG